MVWKVLAFLFDKFVETAYPSELNHMLFLPLHKKGPKDNPDNYHGISLIHPLGHLFSKIVTACLESDECAARAACQSGFHTFYRVEDNCLILQTAIELAHI